jgi:bacillithiol system protein YtxJ
MYNLRTSVDLEEAIRRSHEQPVVIFKHSATCGTSAMAHEEIEAFIEGAPWADVFVVSVHGGRAVSDEIAARFKVRHESPQALVIKNGALAWHASHFRVTSQAVAAALGPREPFPQK